MSTRLKTIDKQLPGLGLERPNGSRPSVLVTAATSSNRR